MQEHDTASVTRLATQIQVIGQRARHLAAHLEALPSSPQASRATQVSRQLQAHLDAARDALTEHAPDPLTSFQG